MVIRSVLGNLQNIDIPVQDSAAHFYQYSSRHGGVIQVDLSKKVPQLIDDNFFVKGPLLLLLGLFQSLYIDV